MGKGEIARNEQFLLFPQCFLPIWTSFCNFHQTLNCRLQTLSIWKSLKPSFGKGLNYRKGEKGENADNQGTQGPEKCLIDGLYGVSRCFQQYFSYIAAASAPTYSFLEFFLLVLRTIFFSSHWLLSHITIVETTDNGESLKSAFKEQYY